MLLLYYTHSILFYLGLPTFQTNNDFKKHLHSIDYEYLPQEVCVAKCLLRRKAVGTTEEIISYDILKEKDNNWFLKNCLDNCSSVKAINQTKEEHILPPAKEIHENFSFNLICRDDTSLNFKIELLTSNKMERLKANQSTAFELTTDSTPSSFTPSPVTNETELIQSDYGTVFVIKIHLANDADKIFVYLSDENFFTIDQLMANTFYNISVLAVHSNNKYSVISQQQQFKTLRRGYTPGNVTEIKILHFTEDKHNKMHLTATLTWKPATDKTCHYNIICFSPESEDYDLQPLEIRNPRQLYKHELDNLTFSSVYKVGIRASNTKSMRESELFWKTFTVPSCVEWHNYNFNICAPEAPQNLNIEQIIMEQHIYSLNISWLMPTHLPDNYTLRVQDLSLQGEVTNYQLPRNINNFFISKIYLYGVFYEVSLTAYTKGGHTTTTFTDITKTVIHVPEKNPFVKLIAVILAPIFCVIILSLTIFIIYHRRAKLKRYQERCKYFEELEKKAPIDSKNNFDFTTNLKGNSNDLSYQIDEHNHLLYDDEMEIDCKDLILYQVLGEGAFGLVKLGLYKNCKMATAQQVAVKMLKDHPSAEDIYAFRREIEVMKSVEKHPNIVGILGHCTRFSNQMMLITEYCSFGNLLNFLRDEWHFLHKIQAKKQINHKHIAYIELNQEDNSSQELQTPNCLSHSNETENFKNNIQHDEGDKDDDYNSDNKSNNAIEHFKMKYNELNVTASRTFVNNNKNKTNNHNNATSNMSQTLFQHVENSAGKSHQDSNNIPTSTSSILSPAAENKSYGYHGFCTNSCKCNVDVLITTVDSKEIEKQNDELERVLSEQQFHQQQVENINKTFTETTIQIKNCDCKIKETLNKRKFNESVENKSYFKLFTSDNNYLSRKNGKNVQIKKIKYKTKCQSQPGKVTVNNVLNDNGDAEEDVVDANLSHVKRVPLSCGDLLNIARQVAVGMEFLAKNKVVHRDLAARNVLVAPDRTIKIADFGLSRDVYQENMYKKTGNGKLPIKWLALESMTHQVYTTQSDVWSYGILLYEIVTLGATPYPSIPTNRLLHLLKSGYRMEKPKGCGQEIYDLMYSCWNAEPIARPTFNNIIQNLDGMLNCLENPKDFPTIYSELDTNLSKKQESIQDVASDESYLKPL